MASEQLQKALKAQKQLDDQLDALNREVEQVIREQSAIEERVAST